MTSPATDLQSTYPPNNGLRVGVVDSVASDGAVVVSVSGKVVPIAFLDPAGYVAGAPVAILRGESSWLALGVPRTYPAQTFYVASSANVTMTTLAQDITDADITVTVAEATPYHAIAVFDFAVNTAAATTGVGSLLLDTVALIGSAICSSVTSVGRWTVTQQWTGTLTAGSHTFQLSALKTGAGGVLVVNSPSTTLTVRLGA